MTSRFVHRLAAAILLASANAAFAAEPRIEVAQMYNRPPVDEPDDAGLERDAGLSRWPFEHKRADSLSEG